MENLRSTVRFEDKSQLLKNGVVAFILLLLLGTTAALRLVGIRFGLPQSFNLDELYLVEPTLQFFHGDFNPHRFYYPSFLMYIMHAAQRGAELLWGKLDYCGLYLVCRLTTAAFGVAAVGLVFVLGRRLFGKTAGLAAASLTAVSPLLVLNSHYATTDVPLAFFILLTLYAVLRLAEEETLRRYLICGCVFGCAVSIKIPAVVMIVPILAAHFHQLFRRSPFDVRALIVNRPKGLLALFEVVSFMIAAAVLTLLGHADRIVDVLGKQFNVDVLLNWGDRVAAETAALRWKYAAAAAAVAFLVAATFPLWRLELKKIAALIAVALLAFFITTPFALLDYRTFIRDFIHQAVVSQTTWGERFFGSIGLITHSGVFYRDFGPLPLLFFTVGLVGVLRRPNIRHVLLLVSFLTLFLYLSSWKIHFDRYMVPVIPLMSLIIAYGFALSFSFFQRWGQQIRMPTVMVVPVLLLLLPLSGRLSESIRLDRRLLLKDTRTIAFEWGVQNLPRDAKILIENYAPQFGLAGFDTLNVQADFARLVDEPFVRENGVGFIAVTSKMWKRRIRENGVFRPAEAYDRIAEYADLIEEVLPTDFNPGPIVRIYKVRPLSAEGSGEPASQSEASSE